MAAVLDWTPRDWFGLSLRELCYSHDAKVLEEWDRVAVPAALIHNLSMIVVSLASKRPRTSYKSPQDFNPYRKKTRRGLKVTADNIGLLKVIGNAMARGNGQ